MKTKSRSEGGFNLIEVVIALALLALVMIGISTLYIHGARSVKSGKELTAATAAGTHMMEEMDRLAYNQIYTSFGALSTATSFMADTRTNAYASRWQPQINSSLIKGFGTIVLTPLGGATSPPQFGTAQSIRITATLQWTEGTRVRTANFQTVRF